MAKITPPVAPPTGTSATVDQQGELPWVSAAQQRRLDDTVVVYNPTPGGSSTTVSTTSTTFVDVDATNLAVTFVCPDSGKVLVEAESCVFGANGVFGFMAVRESGALITESQQRVDSNTSIARRSYSAVVSHDGAGAALVPGTTYTFTLAYRTNNAANAYSLQYGGVDGPAVFRVRPLSNRVTIRSSTAVLDTNPAAAPQSLAPDRKTLVGIHEASGRVGLSTDEGATWTAPNATTFTGGITWVHYTADGEILVFTGIGASTPGVMWKSSGWASSPAAATFTQVLAAAGGTDAYLSGAWGFSTYGKYAVVNEYGPKAGPSDMARYSYFSSDYGATWTRIFDLYAQLVPLMAAGWDGTSAHLHGCCYDPYWDAIWLCNGDFGGTPNVPPNVWVSFDHGTTWKVVYSQHQFTSIIALPNCVLFITDAGTLSADGKGNGFFRVPRTSKKQLAMEAALLLDTNPQQTIVGTRATRHAFVPDAPTLIALGMSGVTGSAQLWATYDGYAFKKVWQDTNTYVNIGLRAAVGPTLTNGYLRGYFQNTGGVANALTITPS